MFDAKKHVLHRPWEFSVGGVSVCQPSSSSPGKLSTTSASWKIGRHMLPPFAFVEDFWALWAQLAPPSRWHVGTTTYFFREGLQPSWEAWPSGGAWSLTLERAHVGGEVVDETWQALVLALIGEQLAVVPLEICGAELAIRKTGARLAVWTRTAADAAAQHQVVGHLRRLCSVLRPEDMTWTYTAHADRKRQHSVVQSPSGRRLAVAEEIWAPLYTESRSDVPRPTQRPTLVPWQSARKGPALLVLSAGGPSVD